MTKRRAKQIACAIVACDIEHDLASEGWDDHHEIKDDNDKDRIRVSLEELRDELNRRSRD